MENYITSVNFVCQDVGELLCKLPLLKFPLSNIVKLPEKNGRNSLKSV